MKHITQARLKELFHYNPTTGAFTRNITRNRYQAGTIAGSKDKKGYINIMADNVLYKAHRLAFVYMEGQFPIEYVDHKNRNKSDNSWNNLRHADQTLNARNQPIRIDNISGCRGVCKSNVGWAAYIGIGGVRTYLGYSRDVAKAIKMRKEAEVIHGYV